MYLQDAFELASTQQKLNLPIELLKDIYVERITEKMFRAKKEV